MITLTVLYGTPDDAEKFDAHYFGTHVPLARAVPGLESVNVTKFLPGPDGTPAQFYLMAQLGFADADVMNSALSSAEGQALTADVANLGVMPSILPGSTE